MPEVLLKKAAGCRHRNHLRRLRRDNSGGHRAEVTFVVTGAVAIRGRSTWGRRPTGRSRRVLFSWRKRIEVPWRLRFLCEGVPTRRRGGPSGRLGRRQLRVRSYRIEVRCGSYGGLDGGSGILCLESEDGVFTCLSSAISAGHLETNRRGNPSMSSSAITVCACRE